MEVNKTLGRDKLTVCHLAEKHSDSYFLKAPPPPTPLSILPFRPMISLPLSAALLIFFCFHFFFIFFFKKRLSKVFFLAGEFMETQLNISELQTLPSLPLSLSFLLLFVFDSPLVCLPVETYKRWRGARWSHESRLEAVKM